MSAGNWVLASAEPGQLPPTARLARRYIGECISLGVGALAIAVPSKYHVMVSGSQSTPYVWNPVEVSATLVPKPVCTWPLGPSEWTVVYIIEGSLPSISTTSNSGGHPPVAGI